MSEWTERDIEILKEMTAAGATARLIGERLGRSRNSVISQWHRHGVSIPPRAARPAPIRPTIPIRRPRRRRAAHANVALIALRSGDCRWPIGDNPPFLFCAAAVEADDTSYCPTHHKVAHQIGTKPISKREMTWLAR